MSGLLNPLTASQIEDFVNMPSHALVLVGPTGLGKVQIATNLAEKLLKESFETYPYKSIIKTEDNKAIGIDSIRELDHFLSLKVPSTNNVNRVVIIEGAHLMTLEAQNALLKTLEEPPDGSVLILTVAQEHALLPTIRSRVQTITVKKPEKSSIEAHFQAQGHNAKAVNQAYAVSGGLPGLMQAILSQDDHPLLQAVQQARSLLSQSAYERLLVVDTLSKDRQLAADVTGILQQMASISLQTAKGAAAKKWQRVLEAGYEASEALQSNAQPKLVLTTLMLSL